MSDHEGDPLIAQYAMAAMMKVSVDGMQE